MEYIDNLLKDKNLIVIAYLTGASISILNYLMSELFIDYLFKGRNSLYVGLSLAVLIIVGLWFVLAIS